MFLLVDSTLLCHSYIFKVALSFISILFSCIGFSEYLFPDVCFATVARLFLLTVLLPLAASESTLKATENQGRGTPDTETSLSKVDREL